MMIIEYLWELSLSGGLIVPAIVLAIALAILYGSDPAGKLYLYLHVMVPLFRAGVERFDYL
jgi:hypothetical protein